MNRHKDVKKATCTIVLFFYFQISGLALVCTTPNNNKSKSAKAEIAKKSQTVVGNAKRCDVCV